MLPFPEDAKHAIEVDKLDHMDHEKMPGHPGERTAGKHGSIGGHMMHMGNLKLRLIISLFFAVPIVSLSPMMGVSLPFQLSFPGSDWVVAVLSTLLFLCGGKPFLRGARMELGERKPAMMTLITLGISAAYLYSMCTFILSKLSPHAAHGMDFFWELATLIVIMLLGHWIEMKNPSATPATP